MPQTLNYPGVYVEEVPSGVRPISSVSTSVAAFIGYFREGPLNHAVQVFGMTDFSRIFGGLDPRSEASYAISQFFLNGGTEAYVIRVAAADSTDPLRKAAVRILAADGSTEVLEISAANEGAWGNNLRVDINHDTADPSKLFNLTVTRFSDDSASARPLTTETYLGLGVDNSPAAASNYVEALVNESSRLVTVRHLSTSSAEIPAMTGTQGGDISGLDQAALDGLSAKTFKIKIGAGATTIVTLDTWAADEVKTFAQLRARIEKAIRGAEPANASFAGVNVDLVTMTDGKLHLRVRSGKTGQAYSPNELVKISRNGADQSAKSKLELTADATPMNAFENVQEYRLGQATSVGTVGALKALAGPDDGVGADGKIPGPTEIIGSGAVEPHTGMLALDYVDLFNILNIPIAADLSDAEMTAVISNALSYCEKRRAFLIIDIPKNINDVQEMKDWMDANGDFRHRNSAVYFPNIRIPDPKNDFRPRTIGAGGTIAGIYARTDSARGVWKAPAGIEAKLRGVAQLEGKLTDAQNGALNPLGINCLRSFPIYDDIVWGSRTLDGADAIGSEWKYVPVRRLALMLEESLFRGTKWVVFEPNDEPTWANIRLNVNAFMTSLFRQGAFQGTDPKDAFYVKCDKETTTQDDINKGIVNIEVGFAPLKPAEFVVIKFQQIAGDI